MTALLALLALQDWTHWRGDAARSGGTPHELPAELRLQWTLRLPARAPAWPDQPRMQVDSAYQPVIVGRRLILPSMEIDGVVAYDTRTGSEAWRFWTDAPVRLPAAAYEGKVYVASDDGHLYCLEAHTGALAWKHRGGPSSRRVLGNERLISTWPARGAPVVADGIVYYAAGIWPFMGIFLHALDAGTGRVIWTNDGDGSVYRQQPHNTDAFAGVAPQGPLAVDGDRLLIPGGRSVPAVYDRKTGKLVHYKHAENQRRGGMDVAAGGPVYFAAGAALDRETGLFVADYSRELVVSPDRFWYAGKKDDLLSAALPVRSVKEEPDRKGVMQKKVKWKEGSVESVETPPLTALIRAGTRLYAGVEGGVLVFAAQGRPRLLSEFRFEGRPESLAAADGRLFVMCTDGTIRAYGADDAEARQFGGPRPEFAPRRGYEILVSSAPANELAARVLESTRHVIVVHPEAGVVADLRARIGAAYGIAGAVLQGSAEEAMLPPYLAERVEGPARDAARLWPSVRPYGGVLVLPGTAPGDLQRLAPSLEGGKIAGDTLVREGPLPGAGDWTREHGDAANTRVSTDRRVRAPLGLLWFGGPSHDAILPRHGHGPQPQVLDGRLYIEGVDLMRCIDIYTGRLLWETPLPGLGDFYNNTAHQPGANASGSNYVSTREGIFVAWKDRCVRLDPASGEITREYRLPAKGDWGALAFAGGLLIGGSEPLNEVQVARQTTGGLDEAPAPDGTVDKEKSALLKKLSSFRGDNDSFSSSRSLCAIDPADGSVRWSIRARAGFRHNSICAGNGRLFVIDRLSGPQVDRLKKRSVTILPAPALLCVDLATGRELWRSDDGVFGTWLSYSESRDILVEAGRVARDTLADEPKGMIARNGSTGAVLWEKKTWSGPAMIHGDTILMADRAADLLSGAARGRVHPITLKPVEWTWSRTYGCNTPMASEHLLTFRSGAAGYFDLASDGGTGNFGGFRSSCTNNLVVAGGVLCAPDYTRTCICSYQNQTSIALVPAPDVEMWTFYGTSDLKAPVKRIGINLGAPGDRRASDGTLWLEYPSAGGKSPSAPLSVSGDKLEYFRRHSSIVSGEGHAWVAASGAKGVRELTLTLDKDAKEAGEVRVRLTFVEPDGLAAGERVFDVQLQGQTVIENLDVAKEAGGGWRAVVREFAPVVAGKDLKIRLAPRKGAPVLCGVEVLPMDADQLLAPEAPDRLVVADPVVVEKEDPDRRFRWPAGAENFLWILLGLLVAYVLFTRLPMGRTR